MNSDDGLTAAEVATLGAILGSRISRRVGRATIAAGGGYTSSTSTAFFRFVSVIRTGYHKQGTKNGTRYSGGYGLRELSSGKLPA